jgi:hypothetical protein
VFKQIFIGRIIQFVCSFRGISELTFKKKTKTKKKNQTRISVKLMMFPEFAANQLTTGYFMNDMHNDH